MEKLSVIVWEFWGWFQKLFFDWPPIVLFISLLVVLFFRKEIRGFIIRLRPKKDYDNIFNKIDVAKVENSPVPKSKSSGVWFSIIISIFALTWSVVWSVKTYYQLLPLNQSNLVFSGSKALVHHENNEDSIEYFIENIGKAPAKNVRLTIYSIFLDKDIKEFLPEFVGETPDNFDILELKNQFDTYLPQDMQPQTGEFFGQITYLHYFYYSTTTNIKTNQNDPKRAEMEKKGVAFIIYLEYEDSITGENKKSVYCLKHTIKGGINVLTGNDYEKIYQRLLDGLIEENKNPWLIDYFRNKSPNS